MEEHQKTSSDANEPHSSLNPSSLAWRQPLPAAMDIKRGTATCLDQYAHQLVTPLGATNTIWQWAEPLRLIGITLDHGQTTESVHIDDIPYRRTAGGGKRGNAHESIPATPRQMQIKAEISRAFGEFAANKFFFLPGHVRQQGPGHHGEHGGPRSGGPRVGPAVDQWSSGGPHGGRDAVRRSRTFL